MTDNRPYANLATLSVGDTASCELVVTEQHVDAFAQLSEDTNPLHLNGQVARQYGFARPVAHGMIALSAISRLIGTKLPGPGSLWMSQELQFVAPVLVGDRITAKVTIDQISAATGIVVLKTEVVNSTTGSRVLVGSAKVKILNQVENKETPAVSDRAAIVTGSSRGLGRAIALGLAGSHIKVAIHYNHSAAEADAVVEAIRTNGGSAVACQADLTLPDGGDRLFAKATEAFGPIDIIVNNATPAVVGKSILETDWSDFQGYLTAYVRSTLRITQLAVPGMQSRKFGRIVNVLCSSALQVPPPRFAAYVTAKSAMAGLSRALAVELGPLGITVNMIAPSMLVTQHAGGERTRQLAIAQAPLRRLAELNDVASATGFLVSDAASFITGAVLPVTGGMVMS